MVKYGKRGNQGGSKGANRTGKTNPNARSSGEDVTKESHRTGTQKYGGHKSGPRRWFPFLWSYGLENVYHWYSFDLISLLNKSYSFIGLVFFCFITIFLLFISL